MNSGEIIPIVKISSDTNVKNAIDYVTDLFDNKNMESVKIIGLSQAITKVVLIVEIVKARIKNLHQINYINSLDSKDKFDSTVMKNVPKIDIILTINEPREKGNGYQMPLDDVEFKKLYEIKSQGEGREEFEYDDENVNS